LNTYTYTAAKANAQRLPAGGSGAVPAVTAD